MKRFLIYGLLGPPLGAVMVFGVMLPVLGFFSGGPSAGFLHVLTVIVLMLPFAYLWGIVPALLAAALDALLAMKAVRVRTRLAELGQDADVVLVEPG